MSAGTDLIFFNDPEDWQVVADITRRAEIINEFIGSQRYFNENGVRRDPVGVLDPDMVIGIKPLQSSAIVVIYVKPVQVLFHAVLNPAPLASDDSEDGNASNGDSA